MSGLSHLRDGLGAGGKSSSSAVARELITIATSSTKFDSKTRSSAPRTLADVYLGLNADVCPVGCGLWSGGLRTFVLAQHPSRPVCNSDWGLSKVVVVKSVIKSKLQSRAATSLKHNNIDGNGSTKKKVSRSGISF